MIFSEALLFANIATFMSIPYASSYDRVLGAVTIDVFWSIRDLDIVIKSNIR